MTPPLVPCPGPHPGRKVWRGRGRQAFQPGIKYVKDFGGE